jgi:hypothetical protein
VVSSGRADPGRGPPGRSYCRPALELFGRAVSRHPKGTGRQAEEHDRRGSRSRATEQTVPCCSVVFGGDEHSAAETWPSTGVSGTRRTVAPDMVRQLAEWAARSRLVVYDVNPTRSPDRVNLVADNA